jgi:hypothetical protein
VVTKNAGQNYWSECGRATSVADSDPLGRPHRSVLPFGSIRPAMQSLKTKLFSATLLLLSSEWCKAQSNVYSLAVYAGGTSYKDLCSFELPFAPHQFKLTE